MRRFANMMVDSELADERTPGQMTALAQAA